MAHIVKRLDAHVENKVNTTAALVGVRAIADIVWRSEPALVAESNHVLVVQAFDVLRDVGSPVVDDAGVATSRVVQRASRLIGELPGEDCWRALIAVDEKLDVISVYLLALGVGIPCRSIATKSGGV